MDKSLEPAIILASSSPRRIELMKNLGLNFEILPADIDETTEHANTPAEVVTELAMLKARRTLALYQSRQAPPVMPYVILAADTLVILDQDILGKPTDKADAISMLKRMAGRSHEVFTGVYTIHVSANGVVEAEAFGISKVNFRQVSDSEIKNYVETGEPMDKAGSYALQGIGAFLIESIDGCPTNIIGLPLALTMDLLRRCQVKIFGC